MTTLTKYRIYCNTEDSWVEGAGESPPTVCYNNNTHTVNQNSIQELVSLSETEVVIKEEDVKTGGNFQTTSFDVNTPANSTTDHDISWPYPVSALAMHFHTADEHYGDVINVCVGPDTLIGSITSDISPATEWVSQNHTIGQTVTYNNNVFTCTTNTISNEVPTDTTYWTTGLEVGVTSDAIQYAYIGHYIKLSDAVNTDNVKRVLSKDTQNNKIYVEGNVNNSYTAGTTQVLRSVYTMLDYIIGPSGRREHGTSKLGASYIPKGVTVRVSYENKHLTEPTRLIAAVDILY